jgi:hypothetical protein
MPGLDPASIILRESFAKTMDYRVKPGNDERTFTAASSENLERLSS